MNGRDRIRQHFAAVTAILGLVTTPLQSAPLEPEQTDVATLKPNGLHRLFTNGYRDGSFTIFDADSGKMEGTLPAGYFPNLAVAPDNSRFFVSETYWTRGSRGTRQDLLSIWDARSLTLLGEISLPGRALIANKLQEFQLSADGTKGYVYMYSPASAVVWVDLRRQKIGGTVETPGCAMIFPWGNASFASLCADGSLALVNIDSRGNSTVTHTAKFFDAESDPIYDNSLVDRVSGKALFISYTGVVYPATLGNETQVQTPWSIQQAAGFAPAGTGAQELAWRPGGAQPFALNRSSGQLFVLMHQGPYWTHKQGGTEIWILDTQRRSLVKRIPLQPAATGGLANDRPPFYNGLGVSQDSAEPQIYLISNEGGAVVLNANTGETLRKVESASGDTVLVVGN